MTALLTPYPLWAFRVNVTCWGCPAGNACKPLIHMPDLMCEVTINWNKEWKKTHSFHTYFTIILYTYFVLLIIINEGEYTDTYIHTYITPRESYSWPGPGIHVDVTRNILST